jgi:hypothetical protein
MDSTILVGNIPFTTINIRSSRNPSHVASSLLNLSTIEKKLEIIIGRTHALFLMGSQLNGDLEAMFVASSNNVFNKIKWLKLTCFFMVVMPLNLWYAIRPFLHIVGMAKISSGTISF